MTKAIPKATSAKKSGKAPVAALKFAKPGGKNPKTHRSPTALAKVEHEPFRLGAVGLIVDGNPTFEAAADYYHKLHQMATSLQFAMGDLMLYAETRPDWGEMWTQMIQEQWSVDTQQSFVNVAKKFPQDRRRVLLTWSHHRLVASLPPTDQDRWLDIAEKQSLSVLKLSSVMKGDKAKHQPELAYVPDAPAVVAIVIEDGVPQSAWQSEPLANRAMAKINREKGRKVADVTVLKVQGPDDVDGDTDGDEPPL